MDFSETNIIKNKRK